jgi:hypothetical protein
MKRFLLGPALAALAIFVWGFLYWGAPPLLPYQTLGNVADSDATAVAIGKLFPASGAYLLPSPVLGEDKMNALAARGPSVEVHLRKEGFTGADMAKCMALGFVHMFVVCVLLTIVLCWAEKSFECWMCRVKFCAALGLLVATCDLGAAIWWHHALGWTLAHAIYDFVTFVIAGLVLAKFVTPKPAPASAPAA